MFLYKVVLKWDFNSTNLLRLLFDLGNRVLEMQSREEKIREELLPAKKNRSVSKNCIPSRLLEESSSE